LDKSQYFSRWVVFSQQGDKVSLVDLHNPEAEPLTYDPWLGLVVSLADGQHTIDQFIEYLAGQYQDGSPENLGATIESALERLVETGTVQLSSEPKELPYYLSLPAERLDVPKALQLMTEDGYSAE
jgi:hypothetical protein